jgi:hypothetical protein
MVEITYQMVLSTLQTLSLTVGVVYYIMTLRNTRKNQQIQLETRQAQLFSTIYSLTYNIDIMKKWVDFSLWEYEDYDDFMNKYGPITNPEAFTYFMLKSMQMEGIGVMVKRGLLNIGLIADAVSGVIVDDWEKVEPIVREYRVRESFPHFQEYHEYLYNEVKKYKGEHPELKT